MASATTRTSPPRREYHATRMSVYEIIASRVDEAHEAALYILYNWPRLERALQALVQSPAQGLMASVHAPRRETPQAAGGIDTASRTMPGALLQIPPQGLMASIHAPRIEIPQAAGGIATASRIMFELRNRAVRVAPRKFIIDGYKKAERVLRNHNDHDARFSLALWLAKYVIKKNQLWGPDSQVPRQMPEQIARSSDFWSQDETTQVAVMNADLLTPPVVTIFRPDWGFVTDAKVIDMRTLPEDHDRKCSICWDDLRLHHDQALELDCGHLFGRECIELWFEVSNQCPMCRHEKSEPPSVTHRFVVQFLRSIVEEDGRPIMEDEVELVVSGDEGGAQIV